MKHLPANWKAGREAGRRKPLDFHKYVFRKRARILQSFDAVERIRPLNAEMLPKKFEEELLGLEEHRNIFRIDGLLHAYPKLENDNFFQAFGEPWAQNV